MSFRRDISLLIKGKAQELGFEFVGFSKAEKLESEEDHLSEWLNRGYHGQMAYMENHFEKRLDPRELVPGSKSVISLMYNYFPKEEMCKSKYKIAKYAYGKDYHKVIKKRLKTLTELIQNNSEVSVMRVFVDSAPLMERQWAEKSGLGWTGKNTLLINKERGSYFFLAEIVLDIELEYDGPIKDYCGSCTRCLDACPTNAFPEAYVLDASKCISYATIELKDDILPEEFKGKMDNWIFGCDICQEVCPWNRFSSPHNESTFEPKNILREMLDEDWADLEEETFNSVFEGSAVKRTKYEGLKRNISYVKTN